MPVKDTIEGSGLPLGLRMRDAQPCAAAAVAEPGSEVCALAAMRAPVSTGFAFHFNHRRRPVTTMAPSPAEDARDPFATYAEPPSPGTDGADRADAIRKTGQQESGTVEPAPAGTATRIVRIVDGACRLSGIARPVDTHLFLNRREDEQTCETLMRIAARTCYLHATLGASLEPRVTVKHNRVAVP